MSPNDDLAMLQRMLLIRSFERALQARRDHGFQLLSTGQEAVAVGVAAALGPHDQMLTSGRSIGAALANGLPPAAVMAELLGRVTGPCLGRGGRGHISQPRSGFFGAHSVVGGNLAVAAGVALALKSEGKGGIAVCQFGDGACGSGALHETMNVAALWRLPLLLVCDNNGYSVSTPSRAGLAPRRLSDLAGPFGVMSATVDGMDVRAVHRAAAKFVVHVRGGNGPGFVEYLSRRFTPHSTSTRETRSAAELAADRARDPISRLASELAEEGRLSPDALAALQHKTDAEIARLAAEIDAQPYPDPAEAFADVV
jgi:TPP-dependent pyruvate/acetoin dehydrogenase alpha subunit